jgi:3-oxoacyl-[acyl-carrier-protein] synthase III
MPYLERVSAFVPESSMTVRELCGLLHMTDGQHRLLTRFLGLDRIAVADNLELPDMLIAACEGVLAGIDRDQVGFLIHAHTMQHVAVAHPHLLTELRRRLGLPNASAFSLSHINCVAGLYGLHLARYLLAGAPPGVKILIVTGDRAPAHQARLIPDTTIQGDGAAACLVGHGPRGHRVLGRALRVLGRFYQCLDCPESLMNEYRLIYGDALAGVMREAADAAGCDPADISLVLPHNVNRLSWGRISRKAGIPAARVYLDNLPKFGHCYSSDPFINLMTARSSGLVKPGELVMLATAGMGAAFAATVLELGEED